MPNPDRWLPARLIPTAGIRGQEEQERRATSALLAVMTAVPEFARAILAHMGAPKGNVSAFCEVPLKSANGKTNRPDGALLIERGRTRWSCLVEVKTATGELRDDQMGSYIEIARAHGFDGVLSISNQISSAPRELPYGLDGRRLGKLTVRHLSWWEVLTEAVIQHEHKGIADPDQAWILGELISYLSHERSGASGFSDMGPDWVSVRESVQSGTLKPQDPGAAAVAERWGQFVRYLCLSLSQALGRDVKARSNTDRAAVLKNLTRDGVIGATIRVPDAAGPVSLLADLRASRFDTSVVIDAPEEGRRPQTRINWILRQLDGRASSEFLEVAFANTKETVTKALNEIENADDFLSMTDPKRMPRRFTLTASRKMGVRRGGDQGFPAAAEAQVVEFYRDVVQGLRAWQPAAPKLPAQVSTDAGGDDVGQPLEQAASEYQEEAAENAWVTRGLPRA
jgi:hypothetical protein